MMKKILRYMTTLAVAVLLAGCAQVEESAEPKGSGAQTSDVVDFDVYTQRSTRSGTTGDVTTGNLKTGNGFGVFAYYTEESNYSSDFIPNFMYNQQVKYNSSAQKFTYEPQKYWPNEDNHHVSFFAYAPWVSVTASTGAAADQTYGITGMTKNTATGDPLIHYVATTDLSKGVDLCWNSKLDQVKSDNAVNFTLAHALSKLNVKVQTSVGVNENTKIYIRSITFSGFTMKGSLNLNSSTAQWTAYEKGGPLNKDAVTFYDGRRDGREGYVADDSEQPAGLNPNLVQSTLWDDASSMPGVTNAAQNLFSSATASTDPAYVIPTGDPVDITIEYDIETADPKLKGYFLSDGKTNGTSISNRITKPYPYVLDRLEAGKSYTINLTLGLTDVTFEATTVKEWKTPDPLLTPLTFEAMEAGAEVTFNLQYSNNSSSSKKVEYSIDDGDTWITYPTNTVIILANVGDKVSFRCNTRSIHYGTNQYEQSNKTFTVTKNCYVYGNILSLVNFDTHLVENATFNNLFSGCTSIFNHPTMPLLLPATYLTAKCYCKMFYGCTNLTTAPALPAEALASDCYYYMFYGCTSLTTPPALPATTLAESCYSSMFNGCTNLTTAPVLPATTLANSCYSSMFNGCTGLTTAPVLPATNLANSCYSSMFNGCTNLTTAPELPATTAKYYCYASMFSDCTSLITAPSVLPATTLDYSCYRYMFARCTSLTKAPDILATNLNNGNGCFAYMFYGCTNLNSIKCLVTSFGDPTTYPTISWVSGVAQSGTFYINSSLDKDNPSPWGRHASGIPADWTIKLDGEE